MDWRNILNEQIQRMRDNNNGRFRGGYTASAIRDHEVETKRINAFMKEQVDHFQAIDMKPLENKVESKNKFMKDILLSLPSNDIQPILDKYPPPFQVEKVDYPGTPTITSSISGYMLNDVCDALTKCLTTIKSKMHSQQDINYADKIYNKSTIHTHNKTTYDHIISRAQALHYIHQLNYIEELLIETGIGHEYIDKCPTIQFDSTWIKKGVKEPLENYMKIGTKYLHTFIDSDINTKVDNIIWPNNFGEWTLDELDRLKRNCLNHSKTTTRMNELSKLELKRQEQELIDAEVEKRLKEEQFEKKG